MTKEDIVAKVKGLNFPKNSYIVFGSAPLTAVGIRKAKDINLLVSPEIYATLGDAGWQKENKGLHDTPFVHGVFEAYDNWDFSSFNPTLEGLLANALEVDGVSFASLEDVQKWKAASGRPKDLADIELIDQYIGSKNAS